MDLSVSNERWKNIAMPSSGDPEQDRRDLEAAGQRMERMDRGRCPNDDGDLVVTEPGVRECPACGFVGVTIPIVVRPSDA